MTRIALPLCFLAAFPSIVHAAAAEDIVVTGQGLPTVIGEAAYDAKVIGRDRLTSSASDRLEDILRDTAGFQQFRRSDSRSAHPTSQGASLRGLGGNAATRALVLLDGAPVADPFGGWINWSALDPKRLGYARVTRGGGAGPFGAGAIAGTIELVSAGPDELAPFAGGIAYGSRDSVSADGSVSGELGAGFASLSGRYDRGDGFIPVAGGFRGPVDQAAGYEQWSVRARAAAPLAGATELQASALLFGDARSRGTPFTPNRTIGVDSSIRLISRADWAWEGLAYIQIRRFNSMFASVDGARSQATPSLDQYNTPASGYGAKVELRPPLGADAELRLGFDYRGATGHSKERFRYLSGVPTMLRAAGGRSSTLGGFAEAGFNPVERWTLTAGARLDRWWIDDGLLFEREIAGGRSTLDSRPPDRAGWEPTGRVGLSYRPAAAITLRAAAYMGYRLPTLNELYRPFRVGNDVTAANGALAPERLKGVEAGFEYHPLSTARITATVFWNRLDNAIANVTLSTGPGGAASRQRQNVDAIDARGVELDASFSYGRWDVSGSYSYADSSVSASGAASALDGLRPAQTPRHQLSGTLGWQADAMAASVTARYVSGQYEDDLNTRRLNGAVTVDAVISRRIGAGLTVEARAENLTDTLVEAGISGAGVIERASPRTLWLSLRYGGL